MIVLFLFEGNYKCKIYVNVGLNVIFSVILWFGVERIE